jgi:WD40 repeat protein
MCSVSADNDRNLWLVGTLGTDNYVHFVEFNEENDRIDSKIYSHQGEVRAISSSPSNQHHFATVTTNEAKIWTFAETDDLNELCRVNLNQIQQYLVI